MLAGPICLRRLIAFFHILNIITNSDEWTSAHWRDDEDYVEWEMAMTPFEWWMVYLMW